MISKGVNLTKVQHDWQETVRRSGCICTGWHHLEPYEPGDIQIHHIVGLTAVRNKVLIGPWFIIPLHWRLHDPNSDFPINVTTNKRKFVEKHGTEKELFLRMLYAFLANGIELPFDMDVLNAIGSLANKEMFHEEQFGAVSG